MFQDIATAARRDQLSTLSALLNLSALLIPLLWISPLGAEEATVAELRQRSLSHWAFQPLTKSNVEVRGASAEIDRLVEVRREAAGLQPVGKADLRTLVRRLYFQLIGLPPTPEELAAAVKNDSPDAFAELVDHLLARPAFGERWGRHWLDVARYADSNGCSIEANNTYDNAWRYRDYVIASFNEDKPFDTFVIEQIAGDLLEATTEYRRAEQLIATGFLMLGPKAFGTGNFEQLRLDAVDDQIDTIGKAILGLSLGCARCHDHKLEPVSTEEYYSLAGIFGSTTTVIHQTGWRSGRTWNRVPLPGLDRDTTEALLQRHQQQLEEARAGKLRSQTKAKLTELENELQKLKQQKKTDSAQVEKIQKQIERTKLQLRNVDRLAKVLPVVSPIPAAMAVKEGNTPTDESVRYGGEPGAKGDVVARRVLQLPNQRGRERYRIPEGVSGRLELARWLVDMEDGAGRLSSRVIANRVWHHLLGHGIVPTVDNLGFTGEPPSHPQLLDYLAVTFVEDGWSIKRLVRRIVLSETYQLASGNNARAMDIDPTNRWLWRHTPRRLEVEAFRDATLAISGKLDRTFGGKTLQHLGLITIASDMIHLDTPSPYFRRTVYLPVIRDALGVSPQIDDTCVLLAAFDGAPPNLVCGARDVSVVPSQNLFLMNSKFLTDNARHTAERILNNSQISTDKDRVDAIFRLALGRLATDLETKDAIELVHKLSRDDLPHDEGTTSKDELSESVATPREIAAWAGLCQAIFSSNEFLFLN